MAKSNNTEQVYSKVYGFIPNWYPFHSMKGMKITNEEFYNKIQVQEKMRVKKENVLEDYKMNFSDLRDKAKEIDRKNKEGGFFLLQELDRCVESGIDAQLFSLSNNVFNNGLNTECNHWEHQGMKFTNYLRSNRLKEYVNENMIYIEIPSELKDLINNKNKEN